MATNIWRGDAPAVTEVRTLQITANDAATTYAVTISNRVLSTTGAGSAALTASTLAQLIGAAQSTYPELATTQLMLGYTAAASIMTFTAVEAGTPLAITSSVASGTGTATLASVTANSGPNDWSVAANWSLGAIPANTDDVYIDGTVDITYGLAQSGVTLTSMNFASTYTGKVGLPDFNTSGSYYEFRTKYLTIGATTINVGDQTLGGSGSGRIKLAPGAHTTTINVYTTSTPADSGRPALLVNGSASSYTMNLLSGSIGVAMDVGSSATVPTVRVGFENSITSDVSLTIGSGVTLTTVSQFGGSITTSAGCTTWTMTAGTGTVLGSAAVTTLTLWPATDQTSSAFWESTGTIATLAVGSNASISFEHDLQGRTVTNSSMYDDSSLLDSFRTVTFSNATSFKGDPFKMTIRRGVNYSMQL